jgi:hypothetical protein
MKAVSVFAALGACLALVSAALSAAPFTPALVFFLIFAPLGTLLAALGQIKSALLIVLATALAWLLTPLREEHLMLVMLIHDSWLFLWVVGWSVATAVLTLRSVRTSLASFLGLTRRGA